MIDLAGPFNSGVAAGGAGVATANQDTSMQLTGKIHGFFVRYNGAVPATADVTISTKGLSPHMPSQALLTLTNANTNGSFYTRKQTCDAAGVAIAGWFDEVLIDDIVNVAVAQTDPTTSVDVWVILERR